MEHVGGVDLRAMVRRREVSGGKLVERGGKWGKGGKRGGGGGVPEVAVVSGVVAADQMPECGLAVT